MNNENVRFPYDSFRKGQKELSDEIAQGVANGDIVVIRAPTGFGKTAAVIYGLLKAKSERVLYVVRTVNEIDPVVRELKRFEVPFTFLFSARRVCPLLQKHRQEVLLNHEDFWRNCSIVRLKGLCPYYEKSSQVDIAEVLKYLFKHQEFHTRQIALDLTKEFGVCPFFSLIKLISSSNVIVATYPYLFEKEIFKEVFYDYDYSDLVVVVDEGHNLLNAQSIVERRVNLEELREAVREIRKHRPEASELASVLERTHNFFVSLANRKWRGLAYVDKNVIAEAIESCELLSDLENEIREELLLKALLGSESLAIARLSLSKVVRWLKSLKSSENYLFVAYEEGSLQLISTPLDPAVVVKEPLDLSKASIVMSGTLPPLETFKAIVEVTKPIRYIDVEILYGPLVPRSNVLTLVATDVTTLYRERGAHMYSKIARYLVTISRTLPGPKLVVYPSYDVMKSVTDLMPIDLDIIVESSSTGLDEVEERVRSSSNVLVNAVAGGKLVEGVEFTDVEGKNVLHIVVVIGVPFPLADDFTEMAIKTLSKRFKSQKDARRGFYLSIAITRVKQALGRAVRSPEDKAVFVLLDYRYFRKDLRELLNIKYDKVVGSPEELEELLKDVQNFLENA
ncbi:MAG: ATP-dependent DNA helicase [Acidilobaceae archaeon]